MDLTKNIPLPELLEGKGLQSAFAKQQQYMEVLFNRGLLGHFKIDLNNTTVATEAFLREYIGYLLTEVSEMYEIYDRLSIEFLENDPLGNSHLFAEWRENILEELADIHSFALELLIFCNIGPNDIAELIQALVEDKVIPSSIINQNRRENILQDLFSCARYLNSTGGFYATGYSGRTLSTNEPSHRLTEPNEKPPVIEFSPDIHVNVQRLCWGLSHQYLMASQKLKKKPWKVQHKPLQTDAFLFNLLMGFVQMYRLFEYLDYNEYESLKFYTLKNQINLERVKSGY